MKDIIIIAVIAVIIGLSAFYVYKAKKSGKKCIGCPDGCSCGSKNNASYCGSCGCCSGAAEKAEQNDLT